MKFPSLQSLYSSFKYVLRRFPFEIAFALLGVVATIINIEISSLEVEISNWCIRLLMVANLGLVLSLSVTLFSESRYLTTARKYALRIIAIILAFLFLFLLNPLVRETDILRFILLALAFHLLVSFAAFPGRDHINAFWQFNKTLFLRFLTGVLYSVVLFLGLAAAIGSMNLLFNFQFESDTFAILWVCIAGLFLTIFFLSGVPEDVNVLEGDKSYPKGLKVFTQYVLIPLASVYVVILLAYEIKILVTWDLPKGLVSNLILGYAVFGILSLLLVYPVRNLEENKWLKTYSKSFYFLLVPLILLLIWAVAARVIDYGVTEERYFLIVLALWLAFITGYFLLSKRQDIRVIPISLCIVTLLTVYGPQGAFAVSKASQKNQLKELFGKYDALKNQRLTPISKPVDSADRARIANIVNYLVVNHGLESIKPISTVNPGDIETHYSNKIRPDSLDLRFVRYQIRQDTQDSLLQALHVPVSSRDPRHGIDNEKLLRFQVKVENVLNTAGYERVITFYKLSSNLNGGKTLFALRDKVYQLKVDTTDHVLITQGVDSVTFNVGQHLQRLISKTGTFKKSPDAPYLIVPDHEMTVDRKLGETQIRLYIYGIEGGYRQAGNKDLYVVHYHGALLIK